MLWRAGELSRADLARGSGLSRSTVSAIVAELLDAGIVSESHVARSQGGRPPIVLRIEAERFFILGLELGASHITALRVDLRGRVRHQASVSHDVEQDPDGAQAALLQLTDEMVASAGEAALVGIGLAVPCPVDPRRPDLLSPRILPKWTDVRLGALLHHRYSAPVLVDNDANLGAVAERWWGAGQHSDDFSYVKVATGVGAGHIFDGHVYRGAFGIAGEIGHTAIDPNGPSCRCGRSGCLETMIGSASLVARARARVAAGEPSSLARAPITMDALLAAAREGDPLAADIVGRAGHFLGIAVANLVNLLNPSLIVLGGHLTEAGSLVLDPLHRVLAERVLGSSMEVAAVEISTMGRTAVALGAATAVLQAALDEPTIFPKPGDAAAPTRLAARPQDHALYS